MKRLWWITLSILSPCLCHKASKPVGKRSFIDSHEHIIGAFILRLVLIPFCNSSSKGFETPRSGVLRILGLERLGHGLNVVVVYVEVKMP